jgi:hypothetical protein
VWQEGLDQLKNPITSSGIEPAAFQLVAPTEEYNHSLKENVALMLGKINIS